ncbi:hypothetical protein NAP1_13858 [Erythrobacter sp. NAP1]|uniref:PilZ domain-containing protein n=1 Tax=Erythrobacter sp. NAP1 TaxID=237727 RepID=UPI0000687582|nr:PilZ domain-containing protein [Erythrobacter sp. NAP1]EAQ28689.1 hypothetical protein NAP1_13858 [Erythrobacter sp. NAP1]
MEHGKQAWSGEEARAAKRASLLLRRAKLVCQSGEYLCLIRDVSSLGVGLGFAHPVPPEKRTLLQLSNDLTYPVERVWTGQRQAGYQFGGEITVEEFLREQSPHPSRPLRLNMTGNVRIQDARQRIDARLVDLSCEGAKVASQAELKLGRLITFELDGLPAQLAQVRWNENGRYGIQFQHAIDTEELARCALHLQPFDKTRSSGFSKLLRKARAA